MVGTLTPLAFDASPMGTFVIIFRLLL